MSKKIIKKRYFQSIVQSQDKPVTLTLTYGDNLGERHHEYSIDYHNPNQEENMYPNLLQIPEWHIGNNEKAKQYMRECIEGIFDTIASTFDFPLMTWEELFVHLNLLDDNVDFDPESYGYEQKGKTEDGHPLYGSWF